MPFWQFRVRALEMMAEAKNERIDQTLATEWESVIGARDDHRNHHIPHVTRFLLAGGAHIDRIGRFDAPSIAAASNPGTVRTMPGGAALNVASNLAALGARTELATILGADEAARSVIATAERRNIQLLGQTADEPTASYTAFLEPDGELTTALADMAIYEAFDPKKVEEQIRSLRADDWLVLDANLQSAALIALCRHARCRIAALTVSRAKAKRLRPVLPQIDLLLTNRAEYEALQPGDAIPSALISNGSKPLTVLDKGSSTQIAVAKHGSVSDVTGAGDALAAAALWTYSQGAYLADAARVGIAAAQAVIAVEGPWRPDLRDAIAAQISAIPKDKT